MFSHSKDISKTISFRLTSGFSTTGKYSSSDYFYFSENFSKSDLTHVTGSSKTVGKNGNTAIKPYYYETRNNTK